VFVLGIFKDKRVLLHDYTPSRLPHRERELKELQRRFEAVLNEDINVKIHVYGKIGTGKTVLCNRLGEDLEREAKKAGKKLKYVNINLAYTPKPYHVMSELLEQVTGSSVAGLSPEQMLANVAKAIGKDGCKIVLALDEADTYVKEGRDPNIFYMLPRIHELHREAARKLSLIYISRSLDWMNKLDPATLDTLGRTAVVHLEKYGLPEVKDITAYRAQEAFLPGAAPEGIIDFIAHISMNYGGVRYALELLFEAGGLAEMEGAEYLKARYVRMIHVSIPKVADGAIYPGELSLHKQLLLKGVIDALQSTGDPYLSFEDTYSSYAVVCEFRDREAEEEPAVRSYINDLYSDGYLLLRKVDEETFVGMEYPFDRLAQVLEGTLREALRHPC
jgi:cell division control protein 6